MNQSQISTLVAYFGIVVLIFFAVKALFQSANDLINNKPSLTVKIFQWISEFGFICIYPGIGIAFTADRCGEHPFELESVPTAYTLWIIFAIAYVISRLFKKHLPPLLLTVCGALMFLGVLFCFFICIHFLPLITVVLFPGINLLYLSPFFCLAFLIKETIRLNQFFKAQLPKDSTVVKNIDTLNNWLYKHHLGFSVLLSAPFILAIQAILFLCNQRPDSVISQFTDSCGYLLSQYQNCSCGGDHYLCSIAANGNKQLVKPSRFGLRQNKKIVVNRQLLVANAFENWLEEYTPRFHKIVRGTYDSMNIPVNAWSKHRRFANVLYVVMKPLEWMFLVWLYLFDKKPENRIAKQYLPKQELENFIQSQYENN